MANRHKWRHTATRPHKSNAKHSIPRATAMRGSPTGAPHKRAPEIVVNSIAGLDEVVVRQVLEADLAQPVQCDIFPGIFDRNCPGDGRGRRQAGLGLTQVRHGLNSDAQRVKKGEPERRPLRQCACAQACEVSCEQARGERASMRACAYVFYVRALWGTVCAPTSGYCLARWECIGTVRARCMYFLS